MNSKKDIYALYIDVPNEKSLEEKDLKSSIENLLETCQVMQIREVSLNENEKTNNFKRYEIGLYYEIKNKEYFKNKLKNIGEINSINFLR